MRILSSRDVASAVVTGLTTGVVAWRILVFLGHGLPLGIAPVALVAIIPLAWLLGVQFGYFLGQWFGFFTQFGRFAAIGFTNAAVDFGVLYMLIAWSGAAAGVQYAIFKTLSFGAATVHSYIWNKSWTFGATNTSGGREFAAFLGVSLFSLLINVGLATGVVSLSHVFSGVDPRSLAGIGAVAGSAGALIANFVGYKFFVFKK